MNRPVILLQTDFSLTWGAAASMKGVIKCTDPALEIQDLCHDIKKFDPWEASLSLNACEPYWPQGTVIVSVVDPGVGTDRKACAALLNDGTYVITPDNGTLTHLKHSPGIREVRQISPGIRFRGKEEVSVFHGRDIFAYCAALLASGKITYEQIGPAYDPSEVTECEEYYMNPVVRADSAECFIMTGLVHFGGIQFNILNADWRKTDFREGSYVHVRIMHSGQPVFEQDVMYAPGFGYVKISEPVLYCGSSGYLSLDCNQDSFMERFGIGTGKQWTAVLSRAEQQ